MTSIRLDDLFTYDEFLRALPEHYGSKPLLQIPINDETLVDYRPVSATEFNQWIDSCATLLSKRGFPPVCLEDRNTWNVGVSVLVPAGIRLLVNQQALYRLGYSPLLTSPRLTGEIVSKLLDDFQGPKRLLYEGYAEVVNECNDTDPSIEAVKAVYFEEFSSMENIANAINFSASHEDNKGLSTRAAYFAHSSGSTGFPKLVAQSNQFVLQLIKYLSNDLTGDMIVTAPIFHMLGTHGYEGRFGQRDTVFFFNFCQPLTPNNVTKTIISQPSIKNAIMVPYTVMEMLKMEEGMNALKKLHFVGMSGGKISKEIGDEMLFTSNTRFHCMYGSTEGGVVMSSYRKTDMDWEWYTPLHGLEEYVSFVDQGDGTFELHLKEDFPMRCLCNSDDGGWDTSDLFIKHPDHDWYKYEGRKDDRVTLSTGEKVLTLPIEYRIRQSPLIKECVVFGIGKAIPGIFIIPAHKEDDTDEFLEKIWPMIADTNEKVEKFSRILKDMVIVLPYDVAYPYADKGSIKRRMFYKEFAEEIDKKYNEVESQAATMYLNKASGMSLKEINDYIMNTLNEVGVSIESSELDLFKAGVDSLQAIAVWGELHKMLYSDLKRTAIYEYPTIKDLAFYIYSLTHSGDMTLDCSLKPNSQQSGLTVKNLIEKYSDFSGIRVSDGNRYPYTADNSSEVVLLTGATGSLGAFVLRDLLLSYKVKKVYCIVRAGSKEEAQDRILKSLKIRGIDLTNEKIVDRIVGIPFELGKDGNVKDCLLSFEPEMLESLSSIIHCAWPVNFNYSLAFFEPHIKAVSDLIKLALSSKRSTPAKFIFCSSISSALMCPTTPIPEAIMDDISRSAAPMGYGQSKLASEHIIRNACSQTGIYARSARIGQIVGDTENGIWNNTEAYPLMIQSAKVLKALPALTETLSWTPVDVVADVLLDILFEGEAKEKSLGKTINGADVVYNVTTPKLVDWTRDLLPTLKKDAGLDFEVVGISEWLNLLEKSPNDAKINPTIKLLDHFDKLYNNRQNFKTPIFDTSLTEIVAPCLLQCDDVIRSGLVKKFVQGWGLI